MSTSPRRPVFLNLVQIRLPIAGVVSIAHRITGVLLVVCTPLLIHWLARSLSGPEGFEAVRVELAGPFAGILELLGLWVLLHHLLAGIRFLLIDVEIGVDKPVYRYSAFAVLIAAPLLALLLLGALS